MDFETRVSLLTERQLNNISLHLDAALENDHGSGDHWILMSVLDKYGFRTNSPTRAMELAEEIITLWYKSQK